MEPSTPDQKQCVFCSKYQRNDGVIYQSEHFWSQLDPVPVTPGHAEVIPKKHIVSLLDLTDEEWLDLKGAIESTIKVITNTDLRAFYERIQANPPIPKADWYAQQMLKHPGLGKKPEGYNFGNNDGEAAGRTIPHFHFHIIPRYFGDVQDPRGGIRHIIPDMGNYKK